MDVSKVYPKALTIAGSDSGGGAGIQADIKTFQELDVFGMSAITAITAQNTRGVSGVYPLTPEAVVAQLQALAEDLPPEAVKTGMLFDSPLITAVADTLGHWSSLQLVVDPVMIAKGGSKLLQDDAIHALQHRLLPLATLITPNIPEAEVLSGMTIRTMDDRKEAARRLQAFGVPAVLIKGGHADDPQAVDLMLDHDEWYTLEGLRLNTPHTHGTGCTFSAAITAELAKGQSLREAVHTAKQFIQAAIEDGLAIGSGHGPTNHWAYRRRLQAQAQQGDQR